MSAKDYYLQAHIPTALFVDISNFCDKTSPYMNTMPGLDQFTTRMKELGVGLDKPVVCYDNRDWRWAARTAWLLEVYGHSDVSILSERVELTESGEAQPFTCIDYGFALREHLLTRFEQVQAIVRGDKTATILDARPPQQFDAGHIEGAVNIPVSQFFAQKIASAEDIAKVFASKNIDLNGPLVFNCNSGIQSSLLYSVAIHIGCTNVSNYAGSWLEYSKRK